MTAAPALEHRPVDRSPAEGLRVELQVASVASGLLLLLDAHRLTGRPPLEVQVQVGRLRHAVKLAIQAQATTRPKVMPGPAGVDSAQALRAWIAAQPWAQPGREDTNQILAAVLPRPGHRPAPTPPRQRLPGSVRRPLLGLDPGPGPPHQPAPQPGMDRRRPPGSGGPGGGAVV